MAQETWPGLIKEPEGTSFTPFHDLVVREALKYPL